MSIVQFLHQNRNSPVRIHILLYNVADSSNNFDDKATYGKKWLVSKLLWTNQN